MARIGRRAFIAFIAALAALRETLASAPPAPSREEFLRWSRRLVGRKSLDAGVAARYLDALLANPANRGLLADLMASPRATPLSDAHVALERTIIEWWYTGVYQVGDEQRVATHADALMWKAVGVNAPGSCAGAFGSWSRAPQRRV